MIRSYVLGALAVPLLGGIAYLAIRGREQDRAIAAMRNDIAAHRIAAAEPERTRSAYEPIPIEPRRGPPLAVSATGEASAPTESDEVPSEHSAASAPKTPEDRRARFDFFLNKGLANTREARELTRTVTGRLNAVLPKTATVTSIDCRSTMCRIEALFENNGESFMPFFDSAFKNPDTRLTSGATYVSGKGLDGHGRTILVTYLAADGESLPDINAM
jgi:hypothetical protein